MSLLFVAMTSGAGCSLLNRHGPEVDCGDLQNGAVNACAEGIIASCIDGDVVFEVCDEDVDTTDADAICEASWQTPGAFRCTPSGSGGNGGNGGSGGSGGGVGPTKIVISTALVTEDSNSDGFVSPGEEVVIQVVPKNTGADPAEGVTASLSAWDTNVALSGCLARGDFGSGQACTSTCDCSNVADSSKQDIGGGQESSYAALEISFLLAETAPLTPLVFDVLFADAAGRTWSEAFEVEVRTTGANIQVGSSPLTDESNSDGKLTPGETATLQIFAENLGSSQALGLTASLTSWNSNVTLSNCLARGNFGSGQSCTSMCDCLDVASSSKQDISPTQSGSYAILEIEFVLAKTAPKTPIVFAVQFEDAWGNTWTDDVTVDVVATGADIVIDTALLTDSTVDDGVLKAGESGTVQIYAENAGSSQVLDLTARATESNSFVTMTSCLARGNFGSGQACTPVCNCINVSSSSKQDISPTQSGSYAILEIDFDLAGGAPATPITFTVTFEDDWDNTWVRTFQIPVSP